MTLLEVAYYLKKVSRIIHLEGKIYLLGKYCTSANNGSTSEKVVHWPVSPNKMFQTEIHVAFLQGHLWYKFQAFTAIFW